jgi:NTE family protein
MTQPTQSQTISALDFRNSVTHYQTRIDALKTKAFSDLTDAQGHQYIDLVLEGGGTLGVALLGYIHVLEQVGLRFIGVGGTSAGAVTAIALAVAAKPAEPRLDKLLGELANMPMASFVDGRKDGDADAMDALMAWLKDTGPIKRIWESTQVLDNFAEIHALNRGDAFRAWMDDLLKRLNGGQAVTVAGLRAHMNDWPELWVSDRAEPNDFKSVPPLWEDVAPGKRRYLRGPAKDQLCVVTADIATETKVNLPKMAPLYWPKPDEVNVADFARASMSIPGFFATFKVNSLPTAQALPLWKAAMQWPDKSFEGDFLPKVHHFVDGGVLSNFPIDAFHNSVRVPLRPTFGVKLQWDEHKHDIQNVLNVLTQSFNAARHVLDGEFIARNPDFRQLVGYIDTGKIGWLDFAMDKATKITLFKLGVASALDFLEGFDWANYKRVRRLLIEANNLQA